MNPAWAQRLTELYFSGSTVLFALHGNEFTALPDFLAQQIFGRCDRTLHYDLGQVQR